MNMPKRYLNFLTSPSSVIKIILFLIPLKILAFNSSAVSTATDLLKLPSGQKLNLVSRLPKGCCSENFSDKNYCFPSNQLYLSLNGKTIDLTSLVKKWNDFYVYFVKIRKNKYFFRSKSRRPL